MNLRSFFRISQKPVTKTATVPTPAKPSLSEVEKAREIQALHDKEKYLEHSTKQKMEVKKAEKTMWDTLDTMINKVNGDNSKKAQEKRAVKNTPNNNVNQSPKPWAQAYYEATHPKEAPVKEEALTIDPNLENISHQQLSRVYEGFITIGKPQEVNQTKQQQSLTTPQTARYVPMQGIWYHLVDGGYYIKYQDNKCYFLQPNDLQPCYLITEQSVVMIGGYQNSHISLGRFSDILNMKPSSKSLLSIYKRTQVEPEVSIGDMFNVKEAIPVW